MIQQADKVQIMQNFPHDQERMVNSALLVTIIQTHMMEHS